MQTFSKKFLAILLTLCMLASFAPFGVFAAEASAEVVSQQLMLGNDLVMHFYTKVENAANATATISVGGTERAAYTLSELTAGENGYDLSVNMAAAEMTEEISLVVYDGQTQLLQKTYSVKAYAQYLLDNNYTDETKALAKEMLNYGAKAQLHFGNKTTDLANAGNEMETSAVIATEVPNVTVADSLSGISYYGASMLFRSKLAVRFYFTGSVSGLTFQVGEKTYTPVAKNDLYYIEVTDINPHQMDTALAVSVTGDDGSLTFSYSPIAYIIRMYHKDTTSQTLKNLLKAANGYFQAAKVFTGVAENRTGTLSFEKRAYSTSTLFQVNTNLPSDTPLKDFLTTDNGCDIDQSANTVQWVGSISMANDNGTIVLTFNFNKAFEAGQTYFLPKGAVFGFTDNSKYTLDKNYTFTFDGASWSVEASEPAVSLTYRWGSNNTIQYNTNLPATTPIKDFLASDNGCNLIQSGDQQVGYISMINADGTIVLSFTFNGAFEVGQSYTLSAGSLFGFTDGSKYELAEDITLYWDGSAWTTEEPAKKISLSFRYGAENLIQVNTNLPATTPIKDFLASDNGCNLIQSGDQQVGYISMINTDGTIVLSFNFNAAFTYGQSYTLAAGSVFGFTDGSSYVLDTGCTLYWDGSAWTTEEPAKKISLSFRYGAENLIQVNTNLPATTPIKDFLASDNGCNLIQSGDQQVGYISMINANGTIVLSFNFNAAFTYGQSYTLAAGSVFGFTDGSSYVLDTSCTLYWAGSAWAAEAPAPQDVLDAQNF